MHIFWLATRVLTGAQMADSKLPEKWITAYKITLPGGRSFFGDMTYRVGALFASSPKDRHSFHSAPTPMDAVFWSHGAFYHYDEDWKEVVQEKEFELYRVEIPTHDLKSNEALGHTQYVSTSIRFVEQLPSKTATLYLTGWINHERTLWRFVGAVPCAILFPGGPLKRGGFTTLSDEVYRQIPTNDSGDIEREKRAVESFLNQSSK